MGLAFGGAASDALFGAGSGNVLTKITKYAATIFFVGAVVLSILQSRFHARHVSLFTAGIGKPGRSAPGMLPPAPASTPNAASAAAVGNTNLIILPPVEDTNMPAAPPPSNMPGTQQGLNVAPAPVAPK